MATFVSTISAHSESRHINLDQIAYVEEIVMDGNLPLQKGTWLRVWFSGGLHVDIDGIGMESLVPALEQCGIKVAAEETGMNRAAAEQAEKKKQWEPTATETNPRRKMPTE